MPLTESKNEKARQQPSQMTVKQWNKLYSTVPDLYRPPLMIITPLISGTLIAPCSLPFPRLVAGQDYSIPVREHRINLNRAQCREIYLRRYFHQYEFVLLMDSDVVVPEEAVYHLLDEWKAGTVPCIDTKCTGKVDPDHGVVTSCALIHRADYEKVDYLGNLDKCQCRILGSLFHTFYVKDCSGFEIRQ